VKKYQSGIPDFMVMGIVFMKQRSEKSFKIKSLFVFFGLLCLFLVTLLPARFLGLAGLYKNQ